MKNKEAGLVDYSKIDTLEELVLVQEKVEAAMQPFYAKAKKIVTEHGILCHENIPYAKHPGVDAVRTCLDVYYREEMKDVPIILYAHGGAWISGDKAKARYKPIAFVPAGYLFVSMNYRFRPRASLTDMVADVVDAMVWLKKNADHYG